MGEHGANILRVLHNFEVTLLKKEPWDLVYLSTFKNLLTALTRDSYGFSSASNPNSRELYNLLNKSSSKEVDKQFPWKIEIKGFPGTTEPVLARAQITGGEPLSVKLILPQERFLPQGFTWYFTLDSDHTPVSDPRIKSIFNFITDPKLPKIPSSTYVPADIADDHDHNYQLSGLVVYSHLTRYITSYQEILPEQLIYFKESYYIIKAASRDFSSYINLYKAGLSSGLGQDTDDSKRNKAQQKDQEPESRNKEESKEPPFYGLIQCHQNPDLWLRYREKAQIVTPSELLKILNEDPEELEPTKEELEALASLKTVALKTPKEAVKTQEELEELEEIERSKRLSAMDAAKTPEELERVRLKNENDPWVKYKDAPDWACQIIEDDKLMSTRGQLSCQSSSK
jgi:hypothetical protein